MYSPNLTDLSKERLHYTQIYLFCKHFLSSKAKSFPQLQTSNIYTPPPPNNLLSLNLLDKIVH